MFSNKKAQSLTINTSIIAILGVITLVVIIMSFSSKYKGANDTATEISGCSISNPLLSDYSKVYVVNNIDAKTYKDSDLSSLCSEKYQNSKYIRIIPPKKSGEEGSENYSICCGEK